MDRYPHRDAQFEPNRRQPIWTLLQHYSVPHLMVLGHYETPCGGCDTIKTTDHVYSLVRHGVEKGYNILYEGIMVQDDTRRILELASEYPDVHVIGLTTPVEECLAGVQARRDARGDERPLDPKNTVNRAKTVRRTCEKLRAAGMDVQFLDREAAYQYCVEALGIK